MGEGGWERVEGFNHRHACSLISLCMASSITSFFYCVIDWPFGWLFIWLIVRLVVWLVNCLAGGLVGWLFGWLIV